MASFGGEWLHADLWMMAAAYLFHLVQNHPFVDGNKRTGLLSTLVFLALNGVVLDQAAPALYDLAIAVAEGRLAKPAVLLLGKNVNGELDQHTIEERGTFTTAYGIISQNGYQRRGSQSPSLESPTPALCQIRPTAEEFLRQDTACLRLAATVPPV